MAATKVREKPLPELSAKEGKYLTFKLLNQEYGFEILKVQEIVKMQPITKVPRAPVFVSGVINLRGKVIPVVDLRLKFGMQKADETERTCIIVVQMDLDERVHIMGTIVDEVSEVIDVSGADIEPAPQLGAGLDTDFILGLAKRAQSVTILLDAVRALSLTQATPGSGPAGLTPAAIVEKAMESLGEDNDEK